MGNAGSNGGGGSPGHRRRGSAAQGHGHHQVHGHHHQPSSPPPPPPPESSPSHYVFAAATPYPPPQYTNPNLPRYYPQYGNYYPPPPSLQVPLPAPYDHHHRGGGAGVPTGGEFPPSAHPQHYPGWPGVSGRPHPCGLQPAMPTPYVEHQKAITIRNDVNLKKETLRIEPDEECPGRFLVAFTFDATLAGRWIFCSFVQSNLCAIFHLCAERILLFSCILKISLRIGLVCIEWLDSLKFDANMELASCDWRLRVL